MPKIRILVVDDSVVFRKILTDGLSADPDLEVVGTAANGLIALQKISQVNPDIITLDVEMPELNGLETLPLIRKDYPKLPVIMFSNLTEKGGTATLDALAAGASDYVSKPASGGSGREAVQEELIRKIKGLVPNIRPVLTELKAPATSVIANYAATLGAQKQAIHAVTIGVSTGGPNALAALLPALPGDLNVPIFIVQHMPPMFTRLLAERLNTQCKLTVVEAAHDQEVQPNTVYIAPGDYHLEVVRKGLKIVTQLHQGPQENSCRPAADPLFRSVARIYRANTLAVVLTGMGRDGYQGCQCLKEVGARIIAQDKETSVVWGMPGYVAEGSLADAVLPLQSIAQEIIRQVSRSASIIRQQTMGAIPGGAS